MLKNDAYTTGDIVRVKKQHPCGSREWEILRVGMDIKLKCCGCGRIVMLPRVKFNRVAQKIVVTSTET